MIKEKKLVMMIGQSDLRMPYQIHPASPARRIPSIPYEMASAFFSFKIFNSCGSSDAAVQMPAPIPIYCV